MKCRKCGQKASINLPEHRLALCKPHYLEWFQQQTERFIDKLHMFTRQERVLVAVSGGKDSLSLWHVLWTLGYQTDGLYIHLGIDENIAYSDQSRAYAEEFAQSHQLKLHVYHVPTELAATIPELSSRRGRNQEKPCATCGLVKRHVMNQFARQYEYQAVATAHNLDDEAAVLFGNTLTWNEELIQRQYPVLDEEPGFARKVKPFYRFYERESAAYALMQNIPYIYDECPFSRGNPALYHKDVLNKLEADHPGTKLVFFNAFLQAQQHHFFQGQPREAEMHLCPRCGQPTQSDDLCSFCRLTEG